MFVNLFVDFIIVIILVGISTVGYRRGLFIMLMRPFGRIGCLIVSFVLCPLLREGLLPMVENKLNSSVITFLAENEANNGLINSDNFGAVNTSLLFGSFNSEDISLKVENGIKSFMVEFAVPKVAFLISTIISFLMIFFVLKVIVLPLISTLSLTLNKGVIGKINSIFGFVITAYLAVVCVGIFVVIIKFSFEWGVLGTAFDNFTGGLLYNMFLRLASYFWS